ncbi:histone-lysine N-methyltransferase SMYD3-like [Dermatophagoides pteronyssinus]|uniref:histone-lysine N-methyltransferase SMYD3-like n=1 Tax=Dermatophagoides pteronyssinus TaxID=6956 RepID=UPI003F66366A
MTSNQDYQCGDVINVDTPFVHVLNLDRKNQYCDYCFSKCFELKKCNQCKQMFYCGKSCQRKDWKHHKWECLDIFSKKFSIIEKNLPRFLLRLYLWIENNPDSLNERRKFPDKNPNSNRCFTDLMTHYEQIQMDPIRMAAFRSLCSKFESLNSFEFDTEKLFEYFCRICINAFTITNCEFNEIGTGLYLAESQLDHSCLPNASPVFNGQRIAIRAIRPIKQGDLITVNYVDLKLSKNIRQEKLLQQYYFQCKCQRCETNDPIDCEKLTELITRMDKAIDRKNWFEAYEIGQKTMPMFKQIYGECHPDLTVQMIRMLKLYLQLIPDNNDNGFSINLNEILKQINETKQAINRINFYDDELYRIFVQIINDLQLPFDMIF